MSAVRPPFRDAKSLHQQKVMTQMSCAPTIPSPVRSFSGTIGTAAILPMLVHEMVHYLQAHTHQSFDCPGAREALAYAAQQRWLEFHGNDLHGAFGIDAMTLKLRTTCLPN